jgi:hypothetical protein
MRDAAKGEMSSVDDFAAFILGMFNYDEPDLSTIERSRPSSCVVQ